MTNKEDAAAFQLLLIIVCCWSIKFHGRRSDLIPQLITIGVIVEKVRLPTICHIQLSSWSKVAIHVILISWRQICIIKVLGKDIIQWFIEFCQMPRLHFLKLNMNNQRGEWFVLGWRLEWLTVFPRGRHHCLVWSTSTSIC